MPRISYPFILVNCKTYAEATGKNVLKLSKIIHNINESYSVQIGIAPQFTDIYRVCLRYPDIPVFAQHMDPIKPGSYTGHILPESLKEAGCVGVIINHSERRIRIDEICECIDICRELELISVVCASTPEICMAIATFSPDIIAIEPPELIGTGIPVSKAKPEVVKRAVDVIKKISSETRVFCGAGITKGEDVSRALELGTDGILVASGVVKAEDPEKVLIEFVEAAESMIMEKRHPLRNLMEKAFAGKRALSKRALARRLVRLGIPEEFVDQKIVSAEIQSILRKTYRNGEVYYILQE